jgi:glutamine cyclotransferase
MKLAIVFYFLALLVASCNNGTSPDIPEDPVPLTPRLNFRVMAFIPHDTSLFTEGLLIHNGKLLESTGSPDDLPSTRSMIGVSDLQTGRYEMKIELDRSRYFGEGIAALNDRLYQLTYKNKTAFVYNASTFRLVDSFTYENTEGWGLTTDGKDLIMSDGSARLSFMDPATGKPLRNLQVTESGVSVQYLNELEYIEGYIYANVWTTNYIVKIDPSDGKVIAKIDLNMLAYDAKTRYPKAEATNGIAYDSVSKNIYVTGKMWPVIYQIRFE